MKKREKIIGIIMLAAIAVWGIMYLPKLQKSGVEIIKPIEKLPRISGAKKGGIVPLEQFDIQIMVEQMKSRSESVDVSSIRDPFKKLELRMSELDFSDLVHLHLTLLISIREQGTITIRILRMKTVS